MCMCGKPTINGQYGYSWDGKRIETYPVNPPDLMDGDELLHDEPGRCGGMDSHSHHFRVIRDRYGRYYLVVRHGGGDERINLFCHHHSVIASLAGMESNDRYFLLLLIYRVCDGYATHARNTERSRWRTAAIEKRIKVNRRGRVAKVEIQEEARV